MAKAIAHNDSPTTLLDQLMREQLRVQAEHRAQMALKRSAIFPLTTMDSYDFDYPPKLIDHDIVHRTATLDFVKDRSNVVFVGPSGVGKTHLANAIGQLACLDMWGRLPVGDVRFTVGHCARCHSMKEKWQLFRFTYAPPSVARSS